MEAGLRLAKTMNHLRPPRGKITGKVLAALLLVVLSGRGAWCVGASAQRVVARGMPLTRLEQNLRRMSAHVSEFVTVSELLVLSPCGNVRPPEALLTPDPMLPVQGYDLDVRVSFIVGADGHVHSAFILESGGPEEDRVILRAIHRWRYRPALCNGVPADSEARIRFVPR